MRKLDERGVRVLERDFEMGDTSDLADDGTAMEREGQGLGVKGLDEQGVQVTGRDLGIGDRSELGDDGRAKEKEGQGSEKESDCVVVEQVSMEVTGVVECWQWEYASKKGFLV